MGNEELKELLFKSLENVNMWLHFMEAKNAALIAFNIALLSAFLSSSLLNLNVFLLSGIVVVLLISIGLSLFSFKSISKSITKIENKGIKENLLHYAYIASLDRDEYLKKIYRRYCSENIMDINSISEIEKDCSEEIIQNSRIALKKQKYFVKAFYVDIFLIMAIILMVICAALYPNIIRCL